jgi:hypothetical protein
MLAGEQKLLWWGIDMRARWRRRVAVVLTYLLIFIMLIAFSERLKSEAYWAMFFAAVGTMGVVWLSVLRQNGIVKRFEDKPHFRVRGMGEVVYVNGLDQWAQYRYGVADFDSASETQKNELLSRYKVGTYLVPRKVGGNEAPWLDEREVKQRDLAERWTLKTGIVLLGSGAGRYIALAADQRTVKPLDVAFELFMLCVLMMTLPKARVLWTENDPREGDGEMWLVPMLRWDDGLLMGRRVRITVTKLRRKTTATTETKYRDLSTAAAKCAAFGRNDVLFGRG